MIFKASAPILLLALITYGATTPLWITQAGASEKPFSNASEDGSEDGPTSSELLDLTGQETGRNGGHLLDEGQQEEELDDDEDDDDFSKHWPITPQACLVLMRLLYSQTAEYVGGNTNEDFYQFASHYQPVLGPFKACLALAHQRYQ